MIMTSVIFVIVLVALLNIGTNPSALANSSLFSPMPERGILMVQQSNPQIPAGVVDAVRQDLSRRTNLATDKLTLSQASRQTWANGCLGLAAPDEFCSQALVEGWRVVMSYKQQTWVYRTDNQGRVIRLEN